MSHSPRRRGDPQHADHRDDRASDPVLAERVARLSDDVEELSAEVRGLRTDLGGLTASLARWEGIREGEATSGVRESPIESAPGVILARWVSAWSPWQVVALAALVVGGPTVAGPAMERLLSAAVPPAPVAVEVTRPALPDLDGRERPVDTGPRIDGPTSPRPTL